MAYSAVKVPLLLLATLMLSLPSYFVLNTLLGVRSDFAAAWRAVVASQAGLTIILVSLAPITAFWYASTSNYRSAILFNALMFAVASAGAQLMLRRAYRPLIEREPKHRWLLRTWIVLYAFVEFRWDGTSGRSSARPTSRSDSSGAGPGRTPM